MRSTFIILLLLFVSLVTLGQEMKATIHFRDGSSFEGYGHIFKQNKIKFRLESQENYEIWTDLLVDEIEFFHYTGSNLYKYVDVRNNFNYKLLKVVAEGEFTLYAQVKELYNNKSSFYANGNILNTSRNREHIGNVETNFYLQRKSDTQFITAKKRVLRNKIRLILDDCEDFTSRYDEGEFKNNTLKEIVEYYNDFCVE